MNEFIKNFLPAFMIIFLMCLFLWNEYRKKSLTIPKKNNKCEGVNSKFYFMFIIAFFITLLYSFAPDIYQYLLPIEELDQPLINVTGIQILKASLMWVIIYQFKVTSLWKLFFKNNIEKDENYLHTYSDKVLMGGLLLMFFGLFITISSLAAIILFVLSIIQYNKHFLSGKNNN